MNYKILSKILDQLNEEVPDISYIRGMVETLLSMAPEERVDKPVTAPIKTSLGLNETYIPRNPTSPEIDLGLGRIPNLASLNEAIAKSVVTEN